MQISCRYCSFSSVVVIVDNVVVVNERGGVVNIVDGYD